MADVPHSSGEYFMLDGSERVVTLAGCEKSNVATLREFAAGSSGAGLKEG